MNTQPSFIVCRWSRRNKLVVLPALVAAIALSGCSGDKDDGGNPPKSPAASDVLHYVPQDAVAGVMLRPRQLLSNDELKNMPIEVASAAGEQYLGIDPLNVEQALLVIGLDGAERPPKMGVVVALATSHDIDQVLPVLRGTTQKEQLDGRTYYRGAGPVPFGYYMPDDKTLLVAPDDYLKEMLSAKGAAGSLAQRLQSADASVDVIAVAEIGEMRKQAPQMWNMMLSQIPPEARSYLSHVERLDALELTLAATDSLVLAVRLHTADDAAAQQTEAAINQLLDQGRQQIDELYQQNPITDDEEYANAFQQYFNRVADVILSSLRPQRDGTEVAVTVHIPIDVGTMAAMGMFGFWSAGSEQEVHQQEAFRRAEEAQQELGEIERRLEREREKIEAFTNPPPRDLPPNSPPPN